MFRKKNIFWRDFLLRGGFHLREWISLYRFVQILIFCTKRVVISTRTFQIPPFNNCPLLRTLVWGTVKQQAARRETKRSPPFSFLLFSSLEAATSSGSSPISMRWVEHCWTIDNKCLTYLFCISQVCHLAIYGDQSGQWPIWCVLYHNIVIFWISKPHVYNLCCRCDLVTYLSHLLLVTSSSSNIVIYCWKVRTHWQFIFTLKNGPSSRASWPGQ